MTKIFSNDNVTIYELKDGSEIEINVELRTVYIRDSSSVFEIPYSVWKTIAHDLT